MPLRSLGSVHKYNHEEWKLAAEKPVEAAVGEDLETSCRDGGDEQPSCSRCEVGSCATNGYGSRIGSIKYRSRSWTYMQRLVSLRSIEVSVYD